MGIEIKTLSCPSASDPNGGKFVVSAVFENFPALMGAAVLDEVVHLIAEKFVKENYGELVAKLDQQAIANLAVADSGKKIAEEIRTRPVVYRERGATHNRYSIF